MTFISFRRLLCILTIAFIFLNCVNSQYIYIANSIHPDYPNKCIYDGPPEIALNIGETRRLSNKCATITCDKNFTVLEKGCLITDIYSDETAHCRSIRGDLSKPFPHCCSEYVC